MCSLVAALGLALVLWLMAVPAQAGHGGDPKTAIERGLINQGLLPGGQGLDAPFGDVAPTSAGKASAGGAAGPPLRVYVVVVDGLNPQEVGQLVPTPGAPRPGALTPTLSQLRAGGTWYEQARAVLPGETLPSHAAMMTGVLPQRSGIIANQYSRGGPNPEYMQYPELLESDTLTTRLERAYNGGVATATVLSKEYLYGLFLGDPRVGSPHPQREADYHWDPRAQPAYIIKPSDHALDPATMDGLLAWIRTQDGSPLPQFAFVNLGDVDRAGHADEEGVATAGADRAAHPGEDELSGTHVSPFRQAAIESADAQLGRLVAELKQTGAWDETVLMVLSDHGMDWGPQHQWVRAHDALIARKYRTGIDPGNADYNIVGGGGSELVYVHREADIAPMAKILCAVPGVAFVATRTPVAGLPPSDCGSGTLAEVGVDHPRSPEIELFTEPGFHSSPGGSGELAGIANPLPGNHGHSVTQHSALLVAGGHPLLRDQAASVPGERVYRRNSFAAPAGGPGVLSVAPTVAALFGIGEPDGGYAVSPLAEAFDPGALAAPGGGAPGLPPQGAGAQAAPTGGDRGRLATTIAPDRREVRYGERIGLSGRVTGNAACDGPRRVTLRRRAAGDSSERAIATSIPVRSDGTWSTRLRPKSSARYRAAVQPNESCEGSLSAPASVPVAARVELGRACARGRLVSGRVLPRAPRTRVVLERRRRGAYRRVARTRLDSASRFRLRLPACSGRYRVVWPTQGKRNTTGAATFRAGGGRP